MYANTQVSRNPTVHLEYWSSLSLLWHSALVVCKMSYQQTATSKLQNTAVREIKLQPAFNSFRIAYCGIYQNVVVACSIKFWEC
ncbi:hypothetical protein E2C01_008071 [Portunus trituberculatus]|uniref:Uncharacterized protein n=1 Tax=Portunus trituberculatus TaxID=210409 RepID=A0A5B7D1T7_PORTR|nr:hypothetical protein [Portunus trituberculatus]